jgi:hypothetical protein
MRRAAPVFRWRLVEVESGILGPGRLGTQLFAEAPVRFCRRANGRSPRRQVQPIQDPTGHVGLGDRREASRTTTACEATEHDLRKGKKRWTRIAKPAWLDRTGVHFL